MKRILILYLLLLDAYIENEKEPEEPLTTKISPANGLDIMNPGWLPNKNPDVPPVNDIIK